MNVIATYLPQFHRTKENDEFWGKGFTDWVAVRNAEKYFQDHYEPRVPLSGYYDLLDRNTIEHQAELMHKYKIDGMCFYHYYFADGKKVLEKPAENLLKWNDIDMPFCFCWANEAWVRSWGTTGENNSWADRYDSKGTKKGAVLLEQKYGCEKDWIKHFEYLLPFFKDQRYIKIDGKPLFWIYRCSIIDCIDDMVQCWRTLAKEYGIGDLFIIGSDCILERPKSLDGYMIHEPVRSLITLQRDYKRIDGIPNQIDYDKLWENILSSRGFPGKTFYEGVVDYDDTPRRGANGRMLVNVTPEKFGHYMARLMAKSKVSDNDIIFVNAWNEWGEGMTLEPNDKDGYEYLKAISYAKEHYQDYLPDFKWITPVIEENGKLNDYLDLYEKWLDIKNQGKSMAEWFKKKGIKTIGVYGYGRFGKKLISELWDGSPSIAYFIDKKCNITDSEYRIYSMDEELPECDAIIVTAPYYYDSIADRLRKKGIKKIISIEDIISSIIENKDY